MPQSRKSRPSPVPRIAAARVVQGVLEGHSLAALIPQQLSAINDVRDRALAQELSYGTLRNYPRLQALLDRLLQKPMKAKDRDVASLLLIGCYQLLYLRMADYAAVNETANGAKQLGKQWAVGLVNGVLRRLQREREPLLAALESVDEARYAMPEWLLREIRRRWPDDWRSRVAALNARPPMTLRVNRRRSTREAYLKRLAEAAIEASANGVAHSGIDLQQPLEVELLPGFDSGDVSVQDAAAQLAADLLEPAPGQSVLDVCAAPGGKACHLLETEPGVSLTAIDIDGERLQRVAENMARLDLQAELAEGDAAAPAGAWAKRSYDRILLDVPCSATGVIRRHPDIKLLRRKSDIAELAILQRRILKAIWPLLKPGGLMLYVTCSILPAENEHQLDWFLVEQPQARERPIDADWGEARSVGRQIAPGEGGMDGFYYALLEKRPS
jgi:16S rRNA (cytosine967-C5)-methyltransferase